MDSPNMLYIGDQAKKLDEVQEKEKLQLRIKNLLQLRNVNFLFGNGTSIPLGAPTISSTKFLIDKFDNNFELANASEKAAFERVKLIQNYLSGFELIKSIFANQKSEIDLESLLSILIQSFNLSDGIIIAEKEFEKEAIGISINIIQTFLYFGCKGFLENIVDNSLNAHKEFIRKALLRSTTLPRIKLFTTNYDLAIERCLDEQGVYYFDGFIGSYQKRLLLDSYNYDLYFPGDTTEGSVNRVDRVLQLYKLHGSINWKRVKETSSNIFGIKQEFPGDKEISDLIIYPSTLKYGETLGFPYSEMFRHFSTSLYRPQTVLFTFGYGFRDDHINRIIYQALSIPTFNLVIVLPEGKEKDEEGNIFNPEIARLIEEVKSQRIIVVSGGKTDNGKLKGNGTFEGFVNEIMPDMEEMKTLEKINDEMDKLFGKKDYVTDNNKVNGDIKQPTTDTKDKNTQGNSPTENKGFKKFIMKIVKEK